MGFITKLRVALGLEDRSVLTELESVKIFRHNGRSWYRANGRLRDTIENYQTAALVMASNPDAILISPVSGEPTSPDRVAIHGI